MAKIRGIKPEFWTDDAVVDLSIPARLLFIGMWNFACDNGHLDDKPKQIKMRVLPADDVNVESLLAELVEHRRIERHDGIVVILNFAKHQKPHKRWWTTCDQPFCAVPDDAPPQGFNRSATVAQQGDNGRTTTDGDGDGDGDGDKPRSRRRAPQTAIPESWKPNAKHQDYASERRLDLSSEAFKFRNHALSQDRRAANWNAAFTNWLAKAAEFAPASTIRKAGDRRPEGW